MIQGKLAQIPDGVRGFDCNQTLTPDILTDFHRRGFRFAIRYVRRTIHHNYDLTGLEANTILSAGLGLMAVQHVDNPGWVPTSVLGMQYGDTAASECSSYVGLPSGTMIWLDLEGVRPRTPHQQVIDFCNSWHKAVEGRGFLPGIYVGYDPGLTPNELYYKLRFRHYWAAYNLNKDQYPLVRGVQLQQGLEKTDPIRYDPDIAMADKRGDRAIVLCRDGWPEV